MKRIFPANALAAALLSIPLCALSEVAETVPEAARQKDSAALPLSGPSVQSDGTDSAAPVSALPEVVVTSSKLDDTPLGASGPEQTDPASPSSAAGDSARLLQDIPGVNLHSAGGISSLPVVHGLADDRLRIQVDGVDPTYACPNHMNSPLSYINPTKVGSVTVFAGLTPVSAGGDSIGGTVQVKSAPPEFAKAGETVLTTGEAGAYYHSNGEAQGYNVGAALAGRNMRLSYDRSTAQADNYKAGKSFKPAGRGGIVMGEWLDGDVVGSSSYDSVKNQDLGVALRSEDHLLQLNVGEQTVGFEGFPNQRMDMTDNRNRLVNLGYTGQYEWGQLETRIFNQDTKHKMDMGPDRFSYGTGMPMDSKGKTWGSSITGDIEVREADIVRLGAEYQNYELDDWWPPVGDVGMMAPNTFWNIRNGERNRVGVFSEWEAHWNPELASLLGIRSDTVIMNTGNVQGYNNFPIWETDAAAFNALDHKRTDHNWDWTALARYAPDAVQTYEIGYARKTRSPNLYERYTWSTQPMASLMNNFVGDGNSYVGDIDLRPETANTFGISGDWHDAETSRWGVKATGYLTYVEDYIDAKRCDAVQCGGESNVTAKKSFVNLQYVNQSARIYGFDVSGDLFLGRADGIGSFTTTGMVNYVRGQNRTTNDNLYNIMPLNVKLALVHNLWGWTNTAEVQLVAEKSQVSQVRNEPTTGGYGLLNLRSSYEWKHVRVDLGVENIFDRYYSEPLGGAYLGQGASMTLNGIPWGVTVPGPGRSFNAAFSVHF